MFYIDQPEKLVDRRDEETDTVKREGTDKTIEYRPELGAVTVTD